MGRFVEGTEFVTESCCTCGIQFAMTTAFRKRKLKDRNTFFCPAGHPQHYTGKSEEQKLKERLERAEQEAARQVSEAALLRQQKNESERRYMRIRSRVSKGVCPCCNRTFQNLMRHMQTEHPDFTANQELRGVRMALGLTQSDLAKELGWSAEYVSLFERGQNKSSNFETAVSDWMNSLAGKSQGDDHE